MKIVGWRKLGLGIGIVLAAYGFIYWKTAVVGDEILVPDIPSNVRDIILGVFITFTGGNAAIHVSRAIAGTKEDGSK
jgi:hypothetical protein